MNARDPRRGSVTIFLVVVFACFITVTAVLFAAAKAVSGRSMADATLQLAGRSVLSEYDVRLLSDYGLLAFRGDETRIEDQVVYYAEASLAARDPFYALYRGGGERVIAQNAYCEEVEVNLKEYSLLDLDNFEAQILEASLSRIAGGLTEAQGDAGSAGTGENEGRVLRKQSVIAALPSHGYDGPLFPSLGALADIPLMEEVFQEGTALFRVSEYALSVFGNHVEGGRQEHFFGNEIEYLIAGKLDDDANYSNVKARLYALRFALNNASFLTDTSKMTRAEELAAAVAAASGETLYAPILVAIIEAWVSAETRNDLMLLEHGEKVAFYKIASQWATQNIGEIWNGWTSDSPEFAANRDGQSYRDYLRLLLYLLDRETKLLRMMDLMQINLKGTYDGDFLMREQYIGFRFSCRVEGDHYAYTEKY